MRNLLKGKAAPQGAEYTVVTLSEDGKVIVKSGEPSNYVDLGLPSGKKWMKYNLGATSETEYGDYYQWGSTTPSTNDPCTEWHWASGTVCHNDVLVEEYDAVYQATNGVAQTPTQADLVELTANTTTAWVTNYNGSGVNGRLFTSKTNGNTMFIPAAGIRNNTTNEGQGSSGYLWGAKKGYTLNFSSNPRYPITVSSINYYLGCNLRGVSSK